VGRPIRPRFDLDDGDTGDFAADSEIGKEFQAGVVTPGSVLTGSLDEFGDVEASEAGSTVIDDDGTPVVTDVSGSPAADVEVADEL